MARSDTRQVFEEQEIPLRTVLIGFVGAPAAWTLHLLVSYFLVALGCTTRWGAIEASLAVTTVVSVAIAGAAGAVAYRTWKRTRTPPEDTSSGEPRGLYPTLMLTGALLAGLFVLLIVLQALPPLFMDPC